MYNTSTALRAIDARSTTAKVMKTQLGMTTIDVVATLAEIGTIDAPIPTAPCSRPAATAAMRAVRGISPATARVALRTR